MQLLRKSLAVLAIVLAAFFFCAGVGGLANRQSLFYWLLPFWVALPVAYWKQHKFWWLCFVFILGGIGLALSPIDFIIQNRTAPGLHILPVTFGFGPPRPGTAHYGCVVYPHSPKKALVLSFAGRTIPWALPRTTSELATELQWNHKEIAKRVESFIAFKQRNTNQIGKTITATGQLDFKGSSVSYDGIDLYFYANKESQSQLQKGEEQVWRTDCVMTITGTLRHCDTCIPMETAFKEAGSVKETDSLNPTAGSSKYSDQLLSPEPPPMIEYFFVEDANVQLDATE